MDKASIREDGRRRSKVASGTPLPSLGQEVLWQQRRAKYILTPLVAMLLASVLARSTSPHVLLVWGVAVITALVFQILVSELFCKHALTRGHERSALYIFAFSEALTALTMASFPILVSSDGLSAIGFTYGILIIMTVAVMIAHVRSPLLWVAHVGPFGIILLAEPWIVGAPTAPDMTILSIGFLAYMFSVSIRYGNLRMANEHLALEKTGLEVALARAQGDLTNSENQRARAMAAGQAFLLGLSAEMNGPVQTLVGVAQTLHEDLADGAIERAQLQVSDIVTSAALLLDFRNDLAELASLKSGTLVVNSSLLDVSSLLTSLQESVAPRLQPLQISLEVLPFGDLPLLFADEHLVRRIALNLVANAISATEHGGRITLAAFHLPDGGLGLRVFNSGTGLSEAELEAILGDFVAGRHDRINAEKPVGLALTIVRGFAELHGGSLSVGRRMGVGAYATVHFPPERLVPKRPLLRLIEAA